MNWASISFHSIFILMSHTLHWFFLSLQNSLTIELKYSTWQVHMIFLTRIKLQSLLWILIDICAFLNPVFFLLFETQAAEYLSDDPLSLASSQWIQNYSEVVKGCLSLFSYFIDMKPKLMSPFFVEKTCVWRKKTCFFDKKWTH